jgi:hypothetical protein
VDKDARGFVQQFEIWCCGLKLRQAQAYSNSDGVGVVVVVVLGMVVIGTGERGIKTRHLQYKYSRFEELSQTNCEG